MAPPLPLSVIDLQHKPPVNNGCHLPFVFTIDNKLPLSIDANNRTTTTSVQSEQCIILKSCCRAPHPQELLPCMSSLNIALSFLLSSASADPCWYSFAATSHNHNISN